MLVEDVTGYPRFSNAWFVRRGVIALRSVAGGKTRSHGAATIPEDVGNTSRARADSFRTTHRYRSTRDDGKDRFHLRKHPSIQSTATL